MKEKPNAYSALERTILACMIIVPSLPFLTILCIGYYYFSVSTENGAISSMRRTVGDHRQMIDAFLKERLADLKFIQRTHSYGDLVSPATLDRVFANLRGVSSAFTDLGIFDDQGLHVAYRGPYALTGKNYLDADWFQEVLEKGTYISDVFLGYRRIPHFIIATAATAGTSRWVIRATIDSQFFNDLVKNVRIGKTGEAYLLNSAGVFQTEQRSGGHLMERNPNAAEEMRNRRGMHPFFADDVTGTAFLYTTVRLTNKDWLLVVRQERSDAFSALRSATILIIIISILGAIAIACSAIILTRFIVRRIQRVDAEKKLLGDQLIRAGRLAEIGEMATGFAHEINNPLQIIKAEQALVEAILTDLRQRGDLKPSGDLDEAEESLAQIQQQVERCADITGAILKFGRKDEPVTARIDIQTFMPEVIAMISKKASVHGITIRCGLSHKTPAVLGDPGQLQQVLLNLFNNAFDAIISLRKTSGGVLEVSSGVGPKGQAEIRIRDNGCGIQPEHIEKLFTPFFTTKPVGKGTGLGLSVCYGIIAKMGGDMQVESEPGKGTAFFIRLPPADGGRLLNHEEKNRP